MNQVSESLKNKWADTGLLDGVLYESIEAIVNSYENLVQILFDESIHAKPVDNSEIPVLFQKLKELGTTHIVKIPFYGTRNISTGVDDYLSVSIKGRVESYLGHPAHIKIETAPAEPEPPKAFINFELQGDLNKFEEFYIPQLMELGLTKINAMNLATSIWISLNRQERATD